MRKKYFFLCLFLILCLSGCDFLKKEKNNDPEPEPNKTLVSYERLTDPALSVSTIDFILNADANFNNKVVQGATKFSVDIYKVIYKTTYKGAVKEVSGACVIPNTTQPLPVLSYQHVTVFHNRDAPSQYIGILNMPIEMAMSIVIASCGFVTAAPDYIGYGTDRSVIHPYHIADSLATACVDMLRAVKEMCAEINVNIKNEYFLTGYSEGAFATLALQKKIEADYAGEFPLKAVSAGAGAYHLLGTTQSFLSRTTLRNPAHLCFILVAYREFYGWDRALSSIFRSPYHNHVAEGLFNGSHTQAYIDSRLTHNTAELFTAAFLSDFKGGGEQTLKNALSQNKLHKGWVPSAPLQLYHGTADETVPAFNSEAAENEFRKSGASNVKYISLAGLNHTTCFLPWAVGTLLWFLSF